MAKATIFGKTLKEDAAVNFRQVEKGLQEMEAAVSEVAKSNTAAPALKAISEVINQMAKVIVDQKEKVKSAAKLKA